MDRPASPRTRGRVGAVVALLVATLVATLAAAATLAACSTPPAAGPHTTPHTTPHSTPHTGPQALAVAAGQRFLDGYVDPGGRVVRRDQGGDTVSEGQGYALLVSVALDRPATFARVWDWTRSNLGLADGLFGYHWADGRVVSSTPAADADSQIGWALELAARRFHTPGYATAARRVAGAVAADEVGYDDADGPILAAGPWGRGGAGAALTAEPGYWAFPAAAALAALTGDRRWQGMAATEAGQLDALTRGGATLPADWVTDGDGHGPVPTTVAGDGTAVGCGPNGLRTLVWAALDPATRALDARWWQLVSADAASAPGTRNLDGSPAQGYASPLSAVAAAAAARAAGDGPAEQSLLGDADTIAQHYPSYYGSAWDALGRLLLTTRRLTG